MATMMIKQLPPEPGQALMGLEKLNLSVFPDCTTSMEIPIVHGKPNIGLDGPENQELKKKFQDYFNKDFDSPEGREWLENYEIKISHDLMSYDSRNIEDLFTVHILKVNNGMGIVAVNTQAVEDAVINTFKFQLTDEAEELTDKVGRKNVKVKAYQALGKLNDANNNRLVLLAKYIFPNGSGVGDNKPLAFVKIEEFIGKNQANAEKFLEVLKLDVEYMDTVVKVKEGNFKGIIRLGQDGHYFLHASGTKVGRNEDEMIAFFTNPNNKDLLGYGTKDDSPYSLTAQLQASVY